MLDFYTSEKNEAEIEKVENTLEIHLPRVVSTIADHTRTKMWHWPRHSGEPDQLEKRDKSTKPSKAQA